MRDGKANPAPYGLFILAHLMLVAVAVLGSM
jgi:hypothetical protein